jgi:hypothetical protein
MHLAARWGPLAAFPLATMPWLHVMAWWTYLITMLACLSAYICRLVVLFRLGSKALDKADPEQMSAIMETITGHRVGRRRHRPQSSRSGQAT